MITIEVPATTANIGPCFDTAGIAFNLFNRFSFEESSKLIIEGCEEEYQNEENLVFVAYKTVFEHLNKELIYPHIIIKSDIPVSRGLGSSSTCIIGGILGANAILGNPLNQDQIFKLCSDIEGHPDNVAPALFGGLTASMMIDEAPLTVRYDIHSSIKFCALIPNFELRTSVARGVLPKSIDFKDAVYNVSRAAVSLRAWETGDTKMLRLSLDDRLHQPYRAPLIDEYAKINQVALENGAIASFISGAGPTIMTLYNDDSYIIKMNSIIDTFHNKWMIVPLSVDYQGAFARNGVHK